MADAILTLNAGSSSIKFALYGATAPLPAAPEFVGQIEGIGAGGSAHLAIRNHDGGEMHFKIEFEVAPAVEVKVMAAPGRTAALPRWVVDRLDSAILGL